MNLQVKLENLTDAELRRLAYDSSFAREEPRKRWSQEEYKQAARLRVAQLVADYLNSRAHLPV